MSTPAVAVTLTTAELHLLHNALQTYLSDFGHEDHDLIEQTRLLIAKLDNAGAADPAPISG